MKKIEFKFQTQIFLLLFLGATNFSISSAFYLSSNASLTTTNNKKSTNNVHLNLLQSTDVHFFQTNDNSPIDGFRSMNKKKRDDFGLTYAFGFDCMSFIKLKQQTLSVQLTNINTMYSRQLESITTLFPGNADYGFYEYLQKKHPDWNGVHLLNQNVISKLTNQIMIGRYVKNMSYFIGFGNVNIDVDNHQFYIQIQKHLHKIIKDRNYFEPNIFANKFLGKNQNYFYLNFATYIQHKQTAINNLVTIDSKAGIGIYANFTNCNVINKFMPYLDVNTNLSFFKTKTEAQKRITWQHKLFISPYEILPTNADPGSIGYYSSTFKINFVKKTTSKFIVQYYLVPYQISIPISNKNSSNNVLLYSRPSRDKGFIESFFYAGLSLTLKQ